MHSIRTVVLIVAAAALNACIYTDRSEIYQKSGSLKSLEIPEEVTSAPLEELYPIPRISPRADAFYNMEKDGFVVPRPDPMKAEAQGAQVRIQKVGDQRWILLEAPASQVWPLTQSFLSRVGIVVEQSNPGSGLIETRWVEFKSDETNKSRFRLKVEQGLRPDTTEVHVSAQQLPVDETTDSWAGASADSERAGWLTEQLANNLALDVENSTASLLGQAVGGEVKANLMIDGEEPVLQLQVNRTRAWATLTHALQQDEFRLWGESPDRGVMYFQYLDPDKQRGRVMRLVRGKSIHQIEEPPHTLDTILSRLEDSPQVRKDFAEVDGAEFGKPPEPKIGYLLLLDYKGQADVRLIVRDMQGRVMDLRTHKKLLTEIRNNLI